MLTAAVCGTVGSVDTSLKENLSIGTTFGYRQFSIGTHLNIALHGTEISVFMRTKKSII
jgi:hypothetical protein